MYFKKLGTFKNTLLFHLTVLYAFIFILSTSVTFLIFYYRIYTVTMEQEDEELLDDAVVFRRLLEQGGIAAVVAEITEEAQTNVDTEEFVRILDAEGQVVASTNVAAWGTIEVPVPAYDEEVPFAYALHTQEVSNLDADARVVTAAIGDGGILQKGEILEEAAEYLGIFRRLFLILLAVLFVFSVLIGRFLARRALVEMEEVTQTAQRISRGQFDRRVRLNGRYEEIQRLGITFNRMLDRIQALLKSMKEINDNIAHDLRSPLARIRGAAEMALMAKRPDHEYREMAISTMEECDSLIEMVNTMLDITESEAGVQEVMWESVDLSALISEAIELFRPIADERRISLHSDVPDGFGIDGDRKKLQRIATNLLENAIKYTPESGQVTVSGAWRSGGVELVFQDNGVGISESDLPRIFERFYRCDRSRSESGVGLGLCLVKAYTESMGGRITVASTPGKGSEFRLVFGPFQSPSTG
jgi:signal transduction histidine kinase